MSEQNNPLQQLQNQLLQQHQQYQQQVYQQVAQIQQHPNITDDPFKNNIKVKSPFKSSTKKSTNPRKLAENRNLDKEADALIDEIRKDLLAIRSIHQALMDAEYLQTGYRKRQANDNKKYDHILEKVNQMSREAATKELINELEIIENELNLARADINATFPQEVSAAVTMVGQMTDEVNEIKYKELKARAMTALNQLKASQKTLSLEQLQVKDDGNDDNELDISTTLIAISAINQMQEQRSIIKELQDADKKRAKDTQQKVLLGLVSTLVSLVAALFGFWHYGISWVSIRDYSIIGIPLGIVVWGFIGSFAAMLTQFYKKDIQEFGNPFKWVVIRPVLGILMSAAIYLAFYSIVFTPPSTDPNAVGTAANHLLPLLIAFFVGYSDTFTYDTLDTIQDFLAKLFSNSSESKNKEIADNKNNNQAVMLTNPLLNQPVVTTPIANTVSDNINRGNNTLPQYQPESINKPPVTVGGSDQTNTIDPNKDVNNTNNNQESDLDAGEDE